MTNAKAPLMPVLHMPITAQFMPLPARLVPPSASSCPTNKRLPTPTVPRPPSPTTKTLPPMFPPAASAMTAVALLAFPHVSFGPQRHGPPETPTLLHPTLGWLTSECFRCFFSPVRNRLFLPVPLSHLALCAPPPSMRSSAHPRPRLIHLVCDGHPPPQSFAASVV